jgi:hypothetical protein
MRTSAKDRGCGDCADSLAPLAGESVNQMAAPPYTRDRNSTGTGVVQRPTRVRMEAGSYRAEETLEGKRSHRLRNVCRGPVLGASRHSCGLASSCTAGVACLVRAEPHSRQALCAIKRRLGLDSPPRRPPKFHYRR